MVEVNIEFNKLDDNLFTDIFTSLSPQVNATSTPTCVTQEVELTNHDLISDESKKLYDKAYQVFLSWEEYKKADSSEQLLRRNEQEILTIPSVVTLFHAQIDLEKSS